MARFETVLCGGCLLTIGLLATPGMAQSSTDTIAIFGGRGSLALPFEPISAAFLAQQVVVTMATAELPAVFDVRDGSPRGHLGEKGEAPGEFRVPYEAVALPGDSVAVLDVGTSRVTVLDADGMVVRTISNLPRIKRLEIRSWPESVVGTGIIFSPRRAGFPLHEVDMSGTSVVIVKSFGGAGDFSIQDEGRLERFLAVEAGGGLVVGHQTDYRIEGWSEDYQQQWTFQDRPPWFQSPSRFSPGFSDEPPPPMMDGVEVEAGGLVWAFYRVPTEDWADHWPADLKRGVEYPSSVVPEPDKLWFTRIQLVDPAAAEVLHEVDLNGVVVESTIDPAGGVVALLATSDRVSGEYLATMIHVALPSLRD